VARLFIRLRSWLTIEEGPSLELVRQRFVALDLETTGLDPRRDTIVSLAAIPFVGGVPAGGYVTFVDPGRAIPPESTAIHGVTDAMVRGAPPLERVLREAEPVFGDAVLVGHNVGFDVAVLARARRICRLPRLRNPALDTGRLAAGLHPEWGDFSLERLAERLGVDVVARHTADGDALTAGRIFVALLPELEARRLRTVSELRWFARRALLR
jgi:DNA polymerase III epsilon subunit family exonuclease